MDVPTEQSTRAPAAIARAYLEPSALDAVVRQKVPVSLLRLGFETRGLTACIGTLTLNECAQPILVDEGEVARSLFGIIRDLRPRFLAAPSDLYEQEIRMLRGGIPVDPHPNVEQEEIERNEVDELADGRISPWFLELVQDRRKTKLDAWQPHWIAYLEEVKKLRQLPAKMPHLGSFQQVEAFFRPDLARFIGGLLGPKISAEGARLMAATIDRYPAIHTSVYYFWNAMSICLVNGCAPSKDKVDDYRHIVEASYCDVFISNDSQLLSSISRFHPTLAPLDVGAFIRSISS